MYQVEEESEKDNKTKQSMDGDKNNQTLENAIYSYKKSIDSQNHIL